MARRLDIPRDLSLRAMNVLHENDSGMYIKPGPKQYPHQWNWDSALIALGLSHFDLPRALLEIRSLLTGQWEDGMLPHVVYHGIKSDYFPNPNFWQIHSSPYAHVSSHSVPVMKSASQTCDTAASFPCPTRISRSILILLCLSLARCELHRRPSRFILREPLEHSAKSRQ